MRWRAPKLQPSNFPGSRPCRARPSASQGPRGTLKGPRGPGREKARTPPSMGHAGLDRRRGQCWRWRNRSWAKRGKRIWWWMVARLDAPRCFEPSFANGVQWSLIRPLKLAPDNCRRQHRIYLCRSVSAFQPETLRKFQGYTTSRSLPRTELKIIQTPCTHIVKRLLYDPTVESREGKGVFFFFGDHPLLLMWARNTGRGFQNAMSPICEAPEELSRRARRSRQTGAARRRIPALGERGCSPNRTIATKPEGEPTVLSRRHISLAMQVRGSEWSNQKLPYS